METTRWEQLRAPERQREVPATAWCTAGTSRRRSNHTFALVARVPRHRRRHGHRAVLRLDDGVTDESTLEGWTPGGRRTTSSLAEVIDQAFDYRGNVTVVQTDGSETVGYLFNRNARRAASRSCRCST